jgi:hypothetical protein
MQRKISSSVAVMIAIAVMAIIALLRELWFFPKPDMIPNPDSSWLIYAAQRMADGEKLYINIMETNPPLILWISLLPVWIGKLLGASPYTIFPLLVTLLNITSLALCCAVMRRSALLSAKPFLPAILLYIAFGFFLLSPAVYGQRELLFISLVLPYLFKTLLEDEKLEKRYDYLITAMAAIGFAIKPFFLLLWGVNELHKAIQQRSLMSLFAQHNWTIGIFQLAYVAAIYSFTPEYFNTIFPALLATYFAYEVSWYNVAKMIAILASMPLILAWLADPHDEYKKLITRMTIWMAACAAFIVLQRKDWLNQLYPLAFMAGLLIVAIFCYLLELWKELELHIGRARFSALCISVVTLISAAYLDGKFWYFMLEKPSVLHTRLIPEINKYADGKNIYPISYNLQTGFPVIALSKGVFRGSFHHLWPLSGIIIREHEERVTPDVAKARQFFYDTLVHDFSGPNPPDFVWVDKNVNMEKIAGYDIDPENRDLIKVLSHDVRFAVLWQNYEQVGEVVGEEPDNKNLAQDEKPEKADRYALYSRIKK